MRHHQPHKLLIADMLIPIDIRLPHHLPDVVLTSALAYRFQEQGQIFARYVSVSVHVHYFESFGELLHSLLGC